MRRRPLDSTACFVYFRNKKVASSFATKGPLCDSGRVFGRDINELYLTNGNNVPDVLAQCTAFVEKHGLVDGVYRISGVASNIKRLK